MLRSVRQLVGFSQLLAFMVLVSWALPAQPEANSSDKFRREIESLLGTTVQTKQGLAQIRQKRDAQGRVRRLFVSGRGFSELQMDENGDGTVDHLEVSKDGKTVTASQPLRGRFLRLVVSEKNANGRIEATYVLDSSGRQYSLLKSRLFTPGAVLNVEGETPKKFEAIDTLVPTSIGATALTASSKTSSEIESATLGNSSVEHSTVELSDDESWRSHQVNTWGPDLTCVSDETALGRLASFQRDWWKTLKYDFLGNSEKLRERLSTAKIFDESCRKKGQEANFRALSSALSEVMMSSSKGELPSSTSTRGRYLRCLELSGLGQVAANMEMHFLQSLDGGSGVQRPIQCDFRSGQAGLSKPAFMFPETRHIKVQLSAADQGKSKTALGSPINYKNALFHELIHVAGVSSEEITHAAQACCGDPTDDRAGSCAKLDNLVLKERRFSELETLLGRSGLMDPHYSDLYEKFGDPFANDLYREFVLGLDVYKKGSLFESGLLSNEEFTKCVKAESEVSCREKWTRHIEGYTAEFFRKECRKHVPAPKRKECIELGKNPNFHGQMAVAVAHSLIRLSSDPLEPGAPALCESARLNLDNNLKNSSSRYAWSVFAILGFSFADADDATADCEGSSGIQAGEPPVQVIPAPDGSSTGEVPRLVVAPSAGGARGDVYTPGTGPRLVTPGSNDLNNATGGVSLPGGDRGVGANPNQNPRNPNRSPLPVTEVKNPGGARNIVDRTYRRATDVVGLTTRGLRDLRNSILPRAVAGERDRRDLANRGSDAQFLVFRPKREEARSMKIDNPFAAGSSLILASAGQMSGAGGASNSGNSTSAFVSSNKLGQAQPTSGAGATSTGASAISAKSGMKHSSSGAPAQNAKSAAGTANSPASNVLGGERLRKPSSAPSVDQNSLTALLRMRYRDLEPRLNEIPIQQILIDQRIQVIRANGSIVGSKRGVRTCYKYDGQEKPLKTPCE